MVKYNFHLRKDKVTQDGLMPIRLLFRIDSAVIKRNTGFSCKPGKNGQIDHPDSE